MKWFQFRVGRRLLAAGLLCAAVVGNTSLEGFREWEQMRSAARVAESNRIADLLLLPRHARELAREVDVFIAKFGAA